MNWKNLFITLIGIIAIYTKGAEFLGDSRFMVKIDGPEKKLLSNDGVYRPRWDRLGAVTQIRLAGNTLLCRNGLCDEFDLSTAPPEYDTAPNGGTFLKLGIGLLKKNITRPYFFYHPYPVVKLLPVVKTKTKNGILFKQILNNFNGYGYKYTKEYAVKPNRKELKITYQLTNTGSKKIVTNQYNHNFFKLALEKQEAGYLIKTSFTPQPQYKTGYSFKYANGVYSDFTVINGACFTISVADIPITENHVELSHRTISRKVEISGDFRSCMFAISYSPGGYISPEIFIDLKILPGQSRTWTRTYKFSAKPAMSLLSEN